MKAMVLNELCSLEKNQSPLELMKLSNVAELKTRKIREAKVLRID